MAVSEERKKRGSAAREWGMEAEDIAAGYFLERGYTIRERNWTHGHCEIDLILGKGQTVVFVEVKARREGDPVEAVTPRKRQLTIRAADVYLRRLPHLYEYRFDIFTLTGTREDYRINHYPDAFMPGVNGGSR